MMWVLFVVEKFVKESGRAWIWNQVFKTSKLSLLELELLNLSRSLSSFQMLSRNFFLDLGSFIGNGFWRAGIESWAFPLKQTVIFPAKPDLPSLFYVWG